MPLSSTVERVIATTTWLLLVKHYDWHLRQLIYSQSCFFHSSCYLGSLPHAARSAGGHSSSTVIVTRLCKHFCTESTVCEGFLKVVDSSRWSVRSRRVMAQLSQSARKCCRVSVCFIHKTSTEEAVLVPHSTYVFETVLQLHPSYWASSCIQTVPYEVSSKLQLLKESVLLNNLESPRTMLVLCHSQIA